MAPASGGSVLLSEVQRMNQGGYALIKEPGRCRNAEQNVLAAKFARQWLGPMESQDATEAFEAKSRLRRTCLQMLVKFLIVRDVSLTGTEQGSRFLQALMKLLILRRPICLPKFTGSRIEVQ